MNSLRTRCGLFLLTCACVVATVAVAQDSELPAKWLEAPEYQNLVSLESLKSLMLPPGELPVPPGVTSKWEKGLPLIQPGEEVVYGDQTFVRRSAIQMHNLETPDGNSQMLNLRVFTATDFGAFYPTDSAETVQYFRDSRAVNVGEDGLLMTQTLPGGLESSSVAFRLGELGFVVTSVIDGEIDGVPLALGGAQAWLKKLKAAGGETRQAMDKTVAMGEPIAATPANIQASGPDFLADLKEAAELGVVNAQMRLAETYQDGAEGVEADPVQAAFWLRKAADQGNAMAQRGLGSYYDFGIGVEQDQAEAVRLYKLAAEQDDAPAAYNLGLSYLRGEGVEADAAVAFRYFKQAARLEFPQGQYKLGSLYDAGVGVEMDKEIAAQWYRKAADQGLASAQNDLGVGYLRGEGVEKNGNKAFAWFSKAAEQGLPMAMYNVASCYQNEIGTEPDPLQEMMWFARSAGEGYPAAMVELASIYLEGSAVVEQDEELARIWLEKAIQAGHEPAAEKLRELDAAPPPPPTKPAPAPARKPAPSTQRIDTDGWQRIEYPALPHTFYVPADWKLNEGNLDEQTIQAYESPDQIPGILVIYMDIGEAPSMEELKSALLEFSEEDSWTVLTPPKEIRVNSTPAAYMSSTMDFAGSEGIADLLCVSQGTRLYIILAAVLKDDVAGRKINRQILKTFQF